MCEVHVDVVVVKPRIGVRSAETTALARAAATQVKRALIAALLVGLASTARAEEPKGFAEFPWGTAAEALRENLLTKRCQSYIDYSRAGGSSHCGRYLVEGLSVAHLRLDFEPENSLAGYYMVVARHSHPTLRTLTLQKFGQPTTRSSLFGFSEQLFWDWDGARAVLIQRCGSETSCLEVKTLPLIRKSEQEAARQRQDLRQSF